MGRYKRSSLHETGPYESALSTDPYQVTRYDYPGSWVSKPGTYYQEKGRGRVPRFYREGRIYDPSRGHVVRVTEPVSRGEFDRYIGGESVGSVLSGALQDMSGKVISSDIASGLMSGEIPDSFLPGLAGYAAGYAGKKLLSGTNYTSSGVDVTPKVKVDGFGMAPAVGGGKNSFGGDVINSLPSGRKVNGNGDRLVKGSGSAPTTVLGHPVTLQGGTGAFLVRKSSGKLFWQVGNLQYPILYSGNKILPYSSENTRYANVRPLIVN